MLMISLKQDDIRIDHIYCVTLLGHQGLCSAGIDFLNLIKMLQKERIII